MDPEPAWLTGLELALILLMGVADEEIELEAH